MSEPTDQPPITFPKAIRLDQIATDRSAAFFLVVAVFASPFMSPLVIGTGLSAWSPGTNPTEFFGLWLTTAGPAMATIGVIAAVSRTAAASTLFSVLKFMIYAAAIGLIAHVLIFFALLLTVMDADAAAVILALPISERVGHVLYTYVLTGLCPAAIIHSVWAFMALRHAA